VVAAEAASALADLADDDPLAVLPACRRLLERNPGCGPLWWVAARVVASEDPVDEAERCAEELESDPTDTLCDASAPPRAVRHGGIGEVVGADVVIVEAAALGMSRVDGATATSRNMALDPSGERGSMVINGDDLGLLEAALAADVTIWVVGGVGRVLPPRLWEALADRFRSSHGARAGDLGGPSRLARSRRSGAVISDMRGVEQVVGPSGLLAPRDALGIAGCPAPAELLVPW
jgi:hypothetical protein